MSEKKYTVENSSSNGNHELKITHKSTSHYYLISVCVVFLWIADMRFRNVFGQPARIVGWLLVIWLLLKYTLPINEKLTVLPNYGLLYEKRSTLNLNKSKEFIAKQDIQCVIINEIFTDSSSILPMLCVLRQDRLKSVTVLFEHTRPKLDDLIVFYNICCEYFD